MRDARSKRMIVVATVIAAALLTTLLVGVFAQGAGELPTIGLRVIGETQLLADSPASVRIIVTDHANGKAVRGALVSIRIVGEGAPEDPVFVGRTDRLGTAAVDMRVPDLEPGDYQLVVHADYNGAREKVTQDITIKRAFQILLTTDKPIYQPSQTMHLRAMALRLPGMQAAAGREVTLEVSDAKGNKVFKHTAEANAFGIVAADFVIADEVNQGRYKIKAILEEDTAEKTVTVKRYVLPKFKISVTTDRDYYQPGQRVEGRVQADYFFGKPVAGGTVDVTVKTFDFEFNDIAHITGTTNAEGSFEFETVLPASFVGQPIEQGNAFLQFEAEVTDQAEHTQTAMATSTVAADDLQISVLPESGSLIPGVDNLVYALVSRPTGEPTQATVTLRITAVAGDTDRTVTLRPQRTDDLGIATFTLPAQLTALLEPAELAQVAPNLRPLAARAEDMSGSSLTLRAGAVADDGSSVSREIELDSTGNAAEASVLLRTDRALYHVGDRLQATALTGAPAGTVYFDVVKDRQTMLTQVAAVKSGQATTRIALGPQVTGTAWLSAYLITPTGQIIRAQRPIYIDPANDLSVDVAADRDTYPPGSEARLDFTVRDSKGRPVAAALGINVVDESVFALQELQPGMEKIFFYLEQELMTPRYEIHGLEMPAIIAGDTGPQPLADWNRKDRAAQIIFASIEAPTVEVFDTDTYEARVSKAREQWRTDLQPKADAIRVAMSKWQEKHDKLPDAEHALYVLIAQGDLKPADIRDLWDRDMTVEMAVPDSEDLDMALLISLGPDGRRGTMDDVLMPLGSPWALARLGLTGQGMGELPVVAFQMAPMAMGGAGLGRGKAAMERDGAAPADDAVPSGGEDKSSVRVRSYFPETMFFEPSLITGADGKATLTMPMADSITTWRLAALANSATGQLGSTTTGLRCFQDFFIDIDLPVALTQNDQVSIPIAVYNYLPTEQTVKLELTREPWFALTGEATIEMKIAANDVDVRYFTIKADKVGNHKLTVHGIGSNMSDAITREIRIEPDGRKVEQTVSDRLDKTVEHTMTIPTQALADASTILVKIYPGIFSQVVEGLDSMLRMPFGCFEQTSASTYPNILVLNYMRTVGQVTPEIDMKASGFINSGYQRMLSFECANGGFSWFGDEPANKMLTSFGLMEFFDMQAVHNVDRAVITRTQQWLLAQQEGDGSWKPDEAYLHQDTWNRIQNSSLLPTAYATWALASTGDTSDGVHRGAAYVRENFAQADDPYSLAICSNALVAADNALADGELDASTIAALDKLLGLAKEKDGRMWWESSITGITQSSGKSADLEATGYAGLALLVSGRYPAQTTSVINYLVSMKDANGTWQSTQATIMALKVLLLSQGNATQKVNAEVTVSVNGTQAEGFALTADNADIMRLVDCRELIKAGDNTVKISFSGEGSCLYQIVERHYMPWGSGEESATRKVLGISVDYDRAQLAKDDILTAAVTVRNNTPAVTSMIIVDLGVPPGFTVQAEDLANLVEQGRIQKYKLTGRQIIVYIEKLTANEVVKFNYHLRAKFPIKAKTPRSEVYEYYNPDNQATVAPQDLEVTG